LLTKTINWGDFKMATVPGTYVSIGESSIERVNYLVDILLNPNLMEFRQILINYEPGTKLANGFKFSYQNWNKEYPVEVFLSQNPQVLPDTNYTVDFDMGKVNMNWELQAHDSIMTTYSFNYFPIYTLEGFIHKNVDIINTAATGPTTNYNINDAPANWDGCLSDLVFASCMERLILDYDLWKGRLIFAIGSQELVSGGGDILGALETLKSNAEERAYRTLENPKFKSQNHVARPTRHYYEALMVGSSTRTGAHGGTSYGKLRGWKRNSFV